MLDNADHFFHFSLAHQTRHAMGDLICHKAEVLVMFNTNDNNIY